MPRSRRLVRTARGWRRTTARALASLMLGGMALMGQAGGAGAQVAGDVEAAFAARITAERQAQGRGDLPTEDDLVAVARDHSAAMAGANRLYHNTQLGQQVQGWQLVAENVGMGSSVDQVHQTLMASPTHRADILDSRFTGIGIGVVQSGGSIWVTQVFRQRAGASAPAPASPPAPAPAPVPAPAPPEPQPAPAPKPPARPVSTATVPATTTTEAPATTTTTAPPPVAPPVVAARVELDPLAVAASAPLPTSADLPSAGLVAAALLWMVSAGVFRVVFRHRLVPAARFPL